MIKLHEVRIGNLFRSGDSVVEVESIKKWRVGLTNGYYSLGDFEVESLTPIIITPDLLERAGAKRKVWNNERYPGRFELDIFIEGESDSWFNYDSAFNRLDLFSAVSPDVSLVKRGIKHLHNLQNIYLELTDKDLTINLIGYQWL